MYGGSYSDWSPGQLRSTASYIFKTEDILGEGATSHVFLGRHKKNGEKVAVKVFNNASYTRPSAVQEREFSVVLKINHENIVQLLAIENDQISKQRIIIMELCDCSVLNLLAKPQYIYGFPETEFLGVLSDVSAGMKYLQEHGIVHRDIKPGNIMRRLGPDRQPTYKLADFGAARELQDDEHFVSLYGTEEYLHPAMFERALLRKPLLKPFTAKVDLWSLGVTLYHIATGILPFRPFGGRRNRTTMHDITTKKATGVISGVQKDSEHGPIVWSTELPKECRLSLGLQLPVTDMLAGLLECNTDKMWSFETYFKTVNDILNMRVIDLLNVTSSQLLKVYVDPSATYAELQEHVAMQTHIPAAQQNMIYDGKIFHPEATVMCGAYPDTREEEPILMIPRLFDGLGLPVLPDAPSMPAVRNNFSLETDYPYARSCVAVLHFLQWRQEQLFTLNTLNDTVTTAVSTLSKHHILQLSVHFGEVTANKEFVEGALKSREQTLNTMLNLVDAYLIVANGSRLEAELIRQGLGYVQSDVKSKRDVHKMMLIKWSAAHDLLQELQVQTSGITQIGTWIKGTGCQPSERCRQRVGVLLEDIEEIMTQFQKDRKVKQLPYNDVQIHKMDKIRLNKKTEEAASLINDHCIARWRDGHSKLMNWFSEVIQIEKSIHTLDSQLSHLVQEYPKLLQKVNSKSNTWDTKISQATERLSLLLKKPQSPKILLPKGSELHQSHMIDQVSMNGTQASIKICYPPTMKRHLTELSPWPSPNPEENSHEMMIPVPKSIKRGVEAFHNQTDPGALRAREEVELGQRLMHEMEGIPMVIPDQPDFSFPNHFLE